MTREQVKAILRGHKACCSEREITAALDVAEAVVAERMLEVSDLYDEMRRSSATT